MNSHTKLRVRVKGGRQQSVSTWQLPQRHVPMTEGVRPAETTSGAQAVGRWGAAEITDSPHSYAEACIYLCLHQNNM